MPSVALTDRTADAIEQELRRMDTPRLTFSAWTAALQNRGFVVLPSSHAVPVQLWLLTPDGCALHFLARGTRLSLRRYASSDLAALVLRSECDCEEHRTAGAAVRTVLASGATPTAQAVYDGAADRGWRGYEAGLVAIPTAAEIFENLLAVLTRAVIERGHRRRDVGSRSRGLDPWENTNPRPSSADLTPVEVGPAVV